MRASGLSERYRWIFMMVGVGGERRRKAESGGPVDAAHVALLHVPFMHPEDSGQGLRGVAALGHFEIVVEAVAVVGMGAVVDDQLRPLVRILAAQVGHALFRHDNLDGMFAVIRMADQRHYRADLA